MKKNYYVTVFIVFGLLSLMYAYLGDNTDSYAENVFSEESKKMEKAFHTFLDKLSNTYAQIHNKSETTVNPKDSTALYDFFTGILVKDKSLKSIVWINNNLKIAFNEDGNSIVHAIDSNSVTAAVKWKRYKNGKLISSWQEHFEKKIDLSKWYAQLAKRKNGIFWKFPDQKDFQEDTFFIGHSYGNNNFIVLGYSLPELSKELKIDADTEGRHLILGLPDGSFLNFSGHHPEIIDQNSKKDSVLTAVINYTKPYKAKKEQATFNFKHGNETFWNHYMPVDPKYGIQQFIYSVPESDLAVGVNSRQNELLKWPGIIMLLIGIGMFFTDPKYFDTKKIKNIPLKDLLKNDEGRNLEFKSSARWDYRQEKVNPALENVILKTIAAFANTDGGTLLIGVDDDKEIIGLEKDFNSLKKHNADYYELHLRNLFHKHFGVKNVSKLIRIAFEKRNEKYVCKIIVLRSDAPLYVKIKDKNGNEREKFFVRSGNSSQEIHSITEITDYINSHFKS